MTVLDEQLTTGGDYATRKTAGLSRMRKAMIGTMVVGAVTVLGGAGTFASFSASTSDTADFTTATVELTDSNTGTTSLFDGQLLAPGVAVEKSVTITSGSDLDGTLFLYRTACTGDAALCSAANLTVAEGATTHYDGTLDALATAWGDGQGATLAEDLSTLTTDTPRTFTITVSLPAGSFDATTGVGSSNALKGLTAVVDLNWLLQA